MIETRFQQTKIGQIPKEWSVVPLKQISSVFGRIGFRGYNVSDLVPEGRGAVTLSPSNIQNGVMNYEKCTYLSWAKYEESPEIKIDNGDILFVKTGSTYGKTAYVENLPYPSTINPQFVVLKKIKCNARVLSYLLKQNNFQKQIESITSGGAIPTMSQSKLMTCLIAMPTDNNEQERIATALSNIDSLISALEILIEKKRNIKQGAMQELLSGKRRLAGFTDTWINKQIGGLGVTYNGLSGKIKEDFGEGEGNYITFLNVLKNPIIKEDIFEKVKIYPNESQNKASKGDLFFNTSSETPEEVGFCSTLESDIDNLYLNSFCFGFRLTDPEVSNVFLAYFFRNTEGRELMAKLANGVTRFNLSKKKMKAAMINLPPTKIEQEAIAKVLRDMDNEIEILEQRLSKYQAIKQGMMQQLLTGKIRLI